MGRPPPGRPRKTRISGAQSQGQVSMEVNVWAPALSQGAPALPRRPSPPCCSRLDPRRRVALVSTLAVASTCSLARSFPSLLRPLVLSPSPSFLSPSFPHFLLPHYLAPRALLARYTRAGACGIRSVSNLF